MQQHRQFSCDGHDGSFLRVAFPSDRQRLAESSQVAVLSERPKDVLRRLNQKAAQQVVSLFRDAQLRVGVSALASRRYEPEIGPTPPTCRSNAASGYFFFPSSPIRLSNTRICFDTTSIVVRTLDNASS